VRDRKNALELNKSEKNLANGELSVIFLLIEMHLNEVM